MMEAFSVRGRGHDRAWCRVRSRCFAIVGIAVFVAIGGGLSACGGDRDAGPPVVITGAAAKRGERLATDNSCASCHTPDGGRSVGPTWKDLAGSDVVLGDGTELVADDAYLARAIRSPKDQVVDGYSAIMPTYELTDAEVDDLVAYLRALSVHTSKDD